MNLRDVEIFKPYASELPDHLLLEEQASESCIDDWLNAQTLRVAKIGAQVLGCYAMERVDTFHFSLLGVVVDRSYRHQGLGRWIVGHALGVAESKGGRHVHLASVGRSRCFERMGFLRNSEGWVFDLIQE